MADERNWQYDPILGWHQHTRCGFCEGEEAAQQARLAEKGIDVGPDWLDKLFANHSDADIAAGLEAHGVRMSAFDKDELVAENERLREVVRAAGELAEALLRGSPGWLDTPAGRKLVDAAAKLPETT